MRLESKCFKIGNFYHGRHNFDYFVKKETGKSAKEYLQLKMLDVAKENLLHPEKSISQVAYILGFQYPQHFVRFFKKYEGITPSQYRQSH